MARLRFNRSLGLTTSGPALEPTMHQTMWWSLPARHSPTTTSETKSSSEQKMRSSTLAPLVGSHTFWERKLSCLKSSKRSPSPTANRFPSRPQNSLNPLQRRKSSPRRGPTESRRERGQHPEGALGAGSRRKPAPSAHSHGPQLPRLHRNQNRYLYGVEMALCIEHHTTLSRPCPILVEQRVTRKTILAFKVPANCVHPGFSNADDLHGFCRDHGLEYLFRIERAFSNTIQSPPTG